MPAPVAGLPLAKDIDDFNFADTAVNETLVRDLGPGTSVADQRDAVPIGRSARTQWRAERQTIDAVRMRPAVLDHVSSSGGMRRLLSYLGPMTIVRPYPEVAPLLAMGTYLRAGAHAGYGLGRYFC